MSVTTLFRGEDPAVDVRKTFPMKSYVMWKSPFCTPWPVR